jgi:CRISPR system Cascade subunit CasD
MPRFLCFRLHGPLASWGDVAVGQRRPTSPHPSKSGVLGLLGAALGLRRDDAEGLRALEGALGFATRTDAAGELLVDFHTAQGPEERLLRKEAAAARKAGGGWHRPATRRAELSFRRAALDTLLSQRQYRVDALWTVAVWLNNESAARWSLQRLAEAVARPTFVPYLGRKSCPVDLPMEPQLVDAANPVDAMERASFKLDEMLDLVRRKEGPPITVQWEGDWPGLTPSQTVRRRDRATARARWQFTERTEHQSTWKAAEEGCDVPEQG